MIKKKIMEREVFELEFTLGNGDKHSFDMCVCEDYSEIVKGTKALIILINGDQLFVEIQQACEFEGVSFKVVGEKLTFHYDNEVINTLLIECK